ncbi:MAG: histidine phosphatase family protein [Lachnospiraceae bacterium]|nr:histidine phosphatase family protein [Lachnospiraceae bacterium]
MDVYLLRHGETDWNRTGRLQGHADTVLNEYGRAQVRDTVKKLCDSGVRVDAVVSSPLKRARESAEIAAAMLDYPAEEIVVEALLIERGFGEAEGMTLAEGEKKYPGYSFPGMEPQRELTQRAGQAFEKVLGDFQGAQSILLVAHGAVLFALLEAVLAEPVYYEGRAACLPQGSIYRIRHEKGKNSLAVYEEETRAFMETDEEQLGRLVKVYM